MSKINSTIMNKLLLLLPILVSCASYTKTFYRNGELLPLYIKTNCGTYLAPVIGVFEEDGIKESNVLFYPYGINFHEDTAKLISIDSLQIKRYKGNKITKLRKTRKKEKISGSTYYWTTTGYGGYFSVLKADSFSVSFVLNSPALSCSDTQSFILKPIRATDKQLSKSFEKINKSK